MTALISAWQFDGAGSARRLKDEAEFLELDQDLPAWAHVNFWAHGARAVAKRLGNIPPTPLRALFEEMTRPGCEVLQSGTLINLRGVNLNEGSDKSEMISIRLWVTGNRIISVERHRLRTIDEIADRLEQPDRQGAANVAEFVIQLADGLTEKIGDVVDELSARLDAIEEDDTGGRTRLFKLKEVRQDVVALRRYIAPQQNALSRLSSLDVPWMSETDRVNMRHIFDSLTRRLEDLDAIRDAATILKDTLAQEASDRMNKTMYVLSVVAGLFLPISFITGLLGINVGGIPGTEDPYAFYEVVGLLTVVLVVEWLLLRRLKLI